MGAIELESTKSGLRFVKDANSLLQGPGTHSRASNLHDRSGIGCSEVAREAAEFKNSVDRCIKIGFARPSRSFVPVCTRLGDEVIRVCQETEGKEGNLFFECDVLQLRLDAMASKLLVTPCSLTSALERLDQHHERRATRN